MTSSNARRTPRNGVRIVGFDNEPGKCDHYCHVGGRERTSTFVSVEQLVEDFIADMELRAAA